MIIAYSLDCLPSSYWFVFTLRKTFWLHWEFWKKNLHQSLWLANHLLSHSDMNPVFKAILLNASFVLNFHPQNLVLLTIYLLNIYITLERQIWLCICSFFSCTWRYIIYTYTYRFGMRFMCICIKTFHICRNN